MLTPAFDPILFINDIPFELDPSDYVLLTRNDHYIIPVPGPDEPTTTAKPETGLLVPSSDLPDGDTIEVFVSLPAAPLSPLDQPKVDLVDIEQHLDHLNGDAMDIAEPLPEWYPSSTQRPFDDDSGDHYLRASSLGLTGGAETEITGGFEDADQGTDCDDVNLVSPSASIVPALPRSEHETCAHTGLYFDTGTSAPQTPTHISTPVATPTMLNRNTSSEVSDALMVPVPPTNKPIPRRRSSQPDVINEANAILATAMKKPRRWSFPCFDRVTPHSSDADNASTVTFFPIRTTAFSAHSSSSRKPESTFPADTTSRVHTHIKTEFSPSPISLASDLKSQVKKLDARLRKETSLLSSHNTMLDTISSRLNAMLSTCNVLAQNRKSLLNQRKSLQYRIGDNYQELKETKVKAQELQERQAEVMEARDKVQYGLDVLMEQRRGANKALANKRLDEALMAKFPDRGARELARQVGWRPRPGQITDGKEHHVIELNDDESGDDEDGTTDKRPEWLRIADAFIDGDHSVDFADISGLQEGLDSVDRRVKQEHSRPVVKLESPPPMDIDGAASLPTTAEHTSNVPSSSPVHQKSAVSLHDSEGTHCAPGINEDLELPVGEITLEKLQAHFRAMDEHRKEAAKMLTVLAGVQRGVKRKEGSGKLVGGGKKRRVVE